MKIIKKVKEVWNKIKGESLDEKQVQEILKNTSCRVSRTNWCFQTWEIKDERL